MLSDALSYPFRGSGLVIIIIGTIIAVLLQFASIAPMVGTLSLILMGGYFTAYYAQIVKKTATGSDDAPDWPDITDFLADMLMPVFQVIGVFLIANVPLMLAIWLTGADSIFSLIAKGLGMFYFPMAMLAVTILGHLGGAMPTVVIPSIGRTFVSYVIVAAIAILLPFLLNVIAKVTPNAFLLMSLGISTALTLILITIHARLLGLFYRNNEERLGWL